ncbi:MAG: Tellurite resistance protein TerB [Bacteroidota bacterium]|jgi:uncharacterized tellurite resistance protein B-like protein
MNATQLSWLAQLVKVDGVLDEGEELIIRRMARNAGIDLSEITDAKDFPKIAEDERVSFFYRALLLASVDGSVDEAEVDLLRRLGENLGFDTASVYQAVAAAEEGTLGLSEEQIHQLLS